MNHSELLTGYLKSLGLRVSNEDATGNNEFPYVRIGFPHTIDDGEGMQRLVVDIDVWDKNTDTTTLDGIVGLINGDGNPFAPTGLNKRTLSDASGAVTYYLDTILALREDDSRLRRRKLIYQAHAFPYMEGAD